jgi:glycopeptide antibiotics resistance protein
MFFLSGKVSVLIAFYNLAANIALFIPFGYLLKVISISRKHRLFLPVLFITIIELAQYFTNRGSLDVDDLLLNLLGVYLGFIMYPLLNRVMKINGK